MKSAIVKTWAVLAVILAAILCITAVPAAAEEDMICFEEKGIYVKIPDSVMYVTGESPDTAPLFSILGGSGMTRQQLLQYMIPEPGKKTAGKPRRQSGGLQCL